MHISADRTRRAAWIALPLAVVASGIIVGSSSYAAFSATTDNVGNTWRTGSVQLTDDDQGAALFDVADLVPGDSGSKTITVTAKTAKPSTVKLYTKDSDDDDQVAQYLDVTVERGHLTTPGDDTSFVADETVSDGTLADLQAATTFGSGLDDWDPATGEESTTYRFTYTLDAATPNTAQDSEAATTFVWEAQSN